MPNVSTAAPSALLGQLAEHSRAALQAAQDSQDLQVRHHVDQMRALRALLQRRGLEDTASAAAMPAGDAELAALRSIQRAQDFVSVWCQRYTQMFTRPVLLQSAEGCHGLLDAELPATWDWGQDLLIAVLPDLTHPLVQALRERGQQRVLLVLPHAVSGPSDWPAQWRALGQGQTLEFSAWSSPAIGQASLIDAIADEGSAALIQQIKQGLMGHLANVATFRAFGRQWLEQGLHNLPRIASHPSWDALAALAQGRPAVVVAPGPSLARNLHTLKDVQDQVLIIATAQAVLALQSAGIAPHVIVVVDPQAMDHYFEGYAFADHTVLAVGRTCAPSTYAQGARHWVTLPASPATDSWIGRIFDDHAPLDAGGSVSIAALSMAIRWGCASVALVGQDLALQDGQQYAPGTADAGLSWQLPSEGSTAVLAHMPEGLQRMHAARQEPGLPPVANAQLLPLPGYHGGQVWTKHDYFLFHGHFERLAREHQAQKRYPATLFNCTEGGAKIDGYAQCPLQQWLHSHVRSAPAIDWALGVRALQAQHQQTSPAPQRLAAWQRRSQQAMQRGQAAAAACTACLQSPPSPENLQRLKQHEQRLLQCLDELEFVSIAYQQPLHDALAAIGLAHDLPSSLQAESELVGLIAQALARFAPWIEQIQAESDSAAGVH